MQERAKELRELIRLHRERYYNSEAEISDAEYDALEAELGELERETPGIAEGILDEVGAPASSLFQTVRHERPMLSLQKAHSQKDLEVFLKRFPGEELLLWPKFDGVSLSLLYQNGELLRAATRGDGEQGEDITDNVRVLVSGIPEKLQISFSGEVRGEVVMLRSDWKKYNKDHPEAPLANPRNATSGTLRSKDASSVADRKLQFFPFDLTGSAGSLDQGLRELGFNPEGYKQAKTVEEVENYIEELEDKRDSLDYEVDGVVVRLLDTEKYEAAGTTSHHPRAALAYKLSAEVGETVLNEVVWQVGKSGTVSPVAYIEPLFIAGTTISRASLHNIAVIDERDIRVGDRVELKRAGDVIPHVIGPVTKVRTGDEKKIIAPKTCPSCSGPLIEVGSSRILECENTQGCPEQRLRRLEHWSSRAAADIDAIGSEWIAKMVEEGLLQSPADFYSLNEEQLLETFAGQRMGKKLAERMISSIEGSKDLGLRRALIGWSIPLASEGTAKRLIKAGYHTPEDLVRASIDDFQQIDDIGPMVARSLLRFFSLEDSKKEIKKLENAGVNLRALPEDIPSVGGKLDGKTVVLTGTLSVSRSDFKKQLESAGAKVSSSVSKNTDFVVVGDNPGSKADKARELGLRILDEKEALSILK